jgi:hypothetical protein
MHSPIRGNFGACTLNVRGPVRTTYESPHEAGRSGGPPLAAAELKGFGMIFTGRIGGVAASERRVPVAGGSA